MLFIRVFNPSKLSVSFLPPATDLLPVEGRRYTLTHSDKTGDLFLSIGYQYNHTVVNKILRDEFLAKWISQNGHYIMKGKVYVSGGEFDEHTAKNRFMIFQREAKLAITAVIYGDRRFFAHYPQLIDSAIVIQYQSNYPQLNKTLYHGTPRQFMNSY